MQTMTISEGFRDAIGDRRVERAFFSTFCLEPDFFELEVLPLLLGSPALSTAENIRYHQLQALMGASRGRFGVAYDATVFTPTLAPRLEVDYLPVQMDNGCHHAKLAIIEVADAEGKQAVIVCAGSFNLTKAGWWENIEVGHWVELCESNAPCNILSPLRLALDFYLARGALPVLQALRTLVSAWSPGPADPACSLYFSGDGERSFTDFLNNVERGHIEIVSPYFAEDSHNARVARFLDKFTSVSVLLPRDAESAATVTQAFHDGLADKVRWCDWSPAVAKEFALQTGDPGKPGYRKLHAKIYAGKDWLFVGSVNFSYNAMFVNVEAGFRLNWTGRHKLLGKTAAVAQFAAEVPAEAQGQEQAAIPFPAVFLVFDWQTGVLEASCLSDGTLVLHDREGLVSMRVPLADGRVNVPAPALREYLRHSSLIRARWERQDDSSAPRDVIVSQRQVYCRPSPLPPMSLHDLLRVLQAMKPSQRTATFGALAARVPRLGPDDPDSLEFLSPLPGVAQDTTFFAEFSQVNAAFWQLKQRLLDHPSETAYYLDGEAPDSLRGIVRTMCDARTETASAPVVRYLALLSTEDLLVRQGRGAGELTEEVRRLVAQEESGPAFAHIPDKEKFLAWIKRMFALPISPIEETDAED